MLIVKNIHRNDDTCSLRERYDQCYSIEEWGLARETLEPITPASNANVITIHDSVTVILLLTQVSHIPDWISLPMHINVHINLLPTRTFCLITGVSTIV